MSREFGVAVTLISLFGKAFCIYNDTPGINTLRFV